MFHFQTHQRTITYFAQCSKFSLICIIFVFSHMSVSCVITVEHQLAEAGFYFIGDENDVDTVACYLCKKVLNGWEEDDDPWTEHKKHAPNCIISQLGKPESQLTLKNFLDVMEIHIQNLVNQYRIEKEKKVKAQVQHFKKVFKANYSAIKQ